MLFAQIVESITIPVLLEEIKKASAGTGQANVIYLFVVVLTLGGLGGFFVLRYMLSHAREIHTEANKTLLDITAKHELRCSSLTDVFSTECAELRRVILRIMSDARDMVHATRDIAGVAVSQKDLLERLSKAEAEVKNKRDRDTPVDS
jgi:hypothetical protein